MDRVAVPLPLSHGKLQTGKIGSSSYSLLQNTAQVASARQEEPNSGKRDPALHVNAGICVPEESGAREVYTMGVSRLFPADERYRVPDQCRKCRRPVNSIGKACSLQAVITSSSRRDPPG